MRKPKRGLKLRMILGTKRKDECVYHVLSYLAPKHSLLIFDFD